jgi:mannitol-1-/sugar-/sorbitol-6-phosphatase
MGTRRVMLLDVDGVLLDSTAAHQSVWRQWARSHGLHAATVLAACAGRRPEDTIREVAPQLNPDTERQVLDALTRSCQVAVPAIPGADSMLGSLPDDRWAIVSSGSAWYVREMFGRIRLPLPRVQVYGEDVANSKPAPDGYLLASRELGVHPRQCLVVEDSPAGVLAGKAAGCSVIAVGTEHPVSALRPADVHVEALPAAANLVHAWLRDERHPSAREPRN